MLTITTKSPYKLCSISDLLITSLLCNFGGLLKRRTLNDYKIKGILEFAEIGELKTKAKFRLSGWHDNIKNSAFCEYSIGPTIKYFIYLIFFIKYEIFFTQKLVNIFPCIF